jgi:hypothetical protein
VIKSEAQVLSPAGTFFGGKVIAAQELSPAAKSLTRASYCSPGDRRKAGDSEMISE